MNDAIKFQNVDIVLHKRPLLTNLNFCVKTGDVVLLNGANGSGKSTLLKVISGLMRPHQGSVTVFGEKLKPGAFAKQTAVMINAPRFLQNLTGFENLWALANIKKQITAETVKNWMQRVGLDPQNPLKVRRYSLGMNQKLGLAQALMEDEALILLDEPLNTLDKKSKHELVALITQLHQERPQQTWVIVSHDDAFASLATRIFEINGEELTENE